VLSTSIILLHLDCASLTLVLEFLHFILPFLILTVLTVLADKALLVSIQTISHHTLAPELFNFALTIFWGEGLFRKSAWGIDLILILRRFFNLVINWGILLLPSLHSHVFVVFLVFFFAWLFWELALNLPNQLVCYHSDTETILLITTPASKSKRLIRAVAPHFLCLQLDALGNLIKKLFILTVSKETLHEVVLNDILEQIF